MAYPGYNTYCGSNTDFTRDDIHLPQSQSNANPSQMQIQQRLLNKSLGLTNNSNPLTGGVAPKSFGTNSNQWGNNSSHGSSRGSFGRGGAANRSRGSNSGRGGRGAFGGRGNSAGRGARGGGTGRGSFTNRGTTRGAGNSRGAPRGFSRGSSRGASRGASSRGEAATSLARKYEKRTEKERPEINPTDKKYGSFFVESRAIAVYKQHLHNTCQRTPDVTSLSEEQARFQYYFTDQNFAFAKKHAKRKPPEFRAGRGFNCNACDVFFFNKADLMVHKATNTHHDIQLLFDFFRQLGGEWFSLKSQSITNLSEWVIKAEREGFLVTQENLDICVGPRLSNLVGSTTTSTSAGGSTTVTTPFTDDIFLGIDTSISQDEFILATYDNMMEVHWPRATSVNFCRCCNYASFDTEELLEEHKKTAKHVEFQGAFESSWCVSCQRHTGSAEGLAEHITTARHTMIKKLLEDTRTKATEFWKRAQMKKKDAAQEGIVPVGGFMCNICNIKLIDEKYAEAHKLTQQHRENVARVKGEPHHKESHAYKERPAVANAPKNTVEDLEKSLSWRNSSLVQTPSLLDDSLASSELRSRREEEDLKARYLPPRSNPYWDDPRPPLRRGEGDLLDRLPPSRPDPYFDDPRLTLRRRDDHLPPPADPYWDDPLPPRRRPLPHDFRDPYSPFDEENGFLDRRYRERYPPPPPLHYDEFDGRRLPLDSHMEPYLDEFDYGSPRRNPRFLPPSFPPHDPYYDANPRALMHHQAGDKRRGRHSGRDLQRGGKQKREQVSSIKSKESIRDKKDESVKLNVGTKNATAVPVADVHKEIAAPSTASTSTE